MSEETGQSAHHHDDDGSNERAKPLDAAIQRLAAANSIAGESPVFEVIEAARRLLMMTRG